MSARHADQKPDDGIHVPYAFTYSDSVDREGDTSLESGDIGKFARQLSDNTIWMLTSTNPTWIEVTGTGATPENNRIDVLAIADTGVSVSKGEVVYIVGHDDTNSAVTVDKARADSKSTMPGFGIAAEAFDDATTGKVRVIGKLFNLDTSSFTLADTLHVSASTAGDIVGSAPSGPNVSQAVAEVLKVDATEGILFVDTDTFIHAGDADPQPIGASAAPGTNIEMSRSDHVHAHGDQSGGSLHAEATESNAGFMGKHDRAFSNAASSRGHRSGAAVTRGSGEREVDVASGEGFVKVGGSIEKVSWAAQTVTIPSSAHHIVYIDTNGNLTSEAMSSYAGQGIHVATATSSGSTIVLLTDHEVTINEHYAKSHEFMMHGVGPIVRGGVLPTINSSNNLRINVSEGSWYVGVRRRDLNAASSISFTYWWRNGSGFWDFSTNVQDVNTSKYDDGSGTLASLPVGKSKGDVLFVSDQEGNKDFHLIYGQTVFDDTDEVNIDGIDVPKSVKKFAARIGLVVSESGASQIHEIRDLRTFLGQVGPLTPDNFEDHGLLRGLGDDDHPQYLLADGVRAMSGSLDMGANNVENVGNVDGVDVSNHSSRHDPGGSDALSTGAPSTIGSSNAEGSAPSFARSDHVHDHGNQGGGSLHANATVSTAGFMPSADKSKIDSIEAGAKDDQDITAGSGLTGGGVGDVTLDVIAADGSIVVNADSIQVGTISDIQHGDRGGGSLHDNATQSTDGFMGSADKAKLDILGEHHQATSTTQASTTSTSYVVMTGMTLTPGAGKYLVTFSGSIGEINGDAVWLSIFVNGSQVTYTERRLYFEHASLIYAPSIQAVLTVGAGENVDVRWKVTGGTLNARSRNLSMVRIGV